MARDQKNDLALEKIGWMPVHFWEKDVLKNLTECIEMIDDVVLDLLVETIDVREEQVDNME
jgi:DNA mismatch endonuclease (patch repair protein)